jgi:hypothetical protein
MNRTTEGSLMITASSLNVAITPIVLISGIKCEVVSFSYFEIICITGQRRPQDVETMSISVLSPGLGYALVDDSAEFLYIDKWSALTSWLNQEPPLDGDLVW